MPAKTPPTEKLSLAAARAEHARLGAEIAEHDRRYYGEDAPIISDADYDALRRRYQALEAAFPALADAEFAQPQGRRRAGGEIRQGAPRRADAVARQHLRATRRSRNSARGCAAFSASATTRRSPSPPSRRSTASPARCATSTASSSRRRRAATVTRARTSPPMRCTIAAIPKTLQRRAARARGARRSLHGAARFRRAQRAPAGGGQAGLRQSAQRGGRIVAPARPARHRRAAAAISSPMPGARSARRSADDADGRDRRLRPTSACRSIR